jgi:hypothetical protein
MRKLFILFIFLNCTSYIYKDYSSSPKTIEDKIQILIKKESVNLLIISPTELLNNSCNYTEEFFQSLVTDSDFQMKQSILKKFAKSESLKIIERNQLSYLIQEMKLQMIGLTSKELSKIGNLTGANYIIINSNEMHCSKGEMDVLYVKESKLVGIQSSEVIGLDRLILGFYLKKGEYKLEKSSLNEENINYPYHLN